VSYCDLEYITTHLGHKPTKGELLHLAAIGVTYREKQARNNEKQKIKKEALRERSRQEYLLTPEYEMSELVFEERVKVIENTREIKNMRKAIHNHKMQEKKECNIGKQS